MAGYSKMKKGGGYSKGSMKNNTGKPMGDMGKKSKKGNPRTKVVTDRYK